MRKKNGSNDLSVRYFSRFLFSYEQDSTQRLTLTVKNSHEKYKERERERERTHALIITFDFLSSSSLICIKEIERKSG